MKSNDILLYARMRQHQARVERARRIVQDAFEKNSAWYIAFSGGKDSTCVLALVRGFRPDTQAASSIQQWRMPETEDYLARITNLHQVASGTDHGTGWSPNWEGEADIPDGVLWVGAAVGGQDKTIKNYGLSITGVFLGLRADECAARRVHLKTQGALFYSKKTSVWQCSPLAEWSVLDVWAFILSNELDYNRAYDRMSEIGVSLEHQRIGPLAVDKVLGRGQLSILKRGWPELFNRYAERHPEARAYV